MRATLSASFDDRGSAKEAAAELRQRGCRVALSSLQSPTAALPASGLHAVNSVMAPSKPAEFILTVQVSEDAKDSALSMIRRRGGKTIH